MLATKGSKNPSPISNSQNNIPENNETHRLSIHYIDKETKIEDYIPITMTTQYFFSSIEA